MQQVGYTYTFAGWKKDNSGEVYANDNLPEVTEDVTYYAAYTAALKQYDITWVVDGNTTTVQVYHGTSPDYGSTPAKESTAQYSYTFTGWKDGNGNTYASGTALPEATGAATYTAQFDETIRSYTITWVIDGTTETSTYEYGAVPAHADPSKENTAQYTYTFTGWDPEIVAVTGDVTYTAQFSSTVNTYTVTWKNYDGTELEKDTTVEYGTAPSYDGTAPVKPATSEKYYVWTGWDPAITQETTVTGDVTYIATFDEKGFVIHFNGNGAAGVSMDDQPFVPGQLQALNNNTFIREGYTFEGWFGSNGKYYTNGEAARFYEEVTLTAEWKEDNTGTYDQTTYTITWFDGQLIEPDEPVTDAAKLREDYVQYVFEITQPTVNTYTGYVFDYWDIVYRDSSGSHSLIHVKSQTDTLYTAELIHNNIQLCIDQHSETGVYAFDITATYTKASGGCTVSAKMMHGTTQIGTIENGIPDNLSIGDTLRLTAPESATYEGNTYTFSHWEYNGKTIPTKIFRIVASKATIDLKACYVGENETVEEQQIVFVSDTYSELVNGVKKIAATLSYDLPDDMLSENVKSVGFYYTRVESEIMGAAPTAKSYTANAPGTKRGTYTLHISSKSNKFEYYLRPFIILEGSSDPIICDDYIYLDWDANKVR